MGGEGWVLVAAEKRLMVARGGGQGKEMGEGVKW